MATKRFEKLDPEKRDHIIRSAIEVFGEQGLDQTTLQDVATRAGVAKGLLYYYFEDRDDLLATLFEFVQSRLNLVLADLPTYHDVESFWQFVERTVTNTIEGFAPVSWMVPFLERVMESVSQGKVPAGFEPRKQMTEQTMAGVVMDGMRLGALRRDLPPELMRSAIMMLMRACETWLFGRIRKGIATPGDAVVVRRLVQDAFGGR
ncbi:MAG: TetR/AcrR family transcriptional regulator [Acidobacteria bacterium]|nr:TetR/AcrR family transcriptional regulator [Acidobacteriota bacterium]